MFFLFLILAQIIMTGREIWNIHNFSDINKIGIYIQKQHTLLWLHKMLQFCYVDAI